MSSTMTSPRSKSDLYKLIRIKENPDGSLTRPEFPSLPATPELTTASQLTLSKDTQLNPTNATFLRLFRPVSPPKTTTGKLPIIIYFHGGGFMYLSAASTTFHNFCEEMSSQSPSLVISVEYRLAPEHRLPAAYEDAMEAMLWLRDQALGLNGCDEWLTELADFSKVFLIGTSSGGNIAYNVSLRMLDLDLYPLKIAGLVMIQPYFGGVEVTKSEHRLANHHVMPLIVVHFMWSLTLPEGCDRDHEYSNPLRDQGKFRKEKIRQLPKCLIMGYGEDPLIDRQKEFANMLETCGVHVIKKFEDDGYHGGEFYDPKKLQVMFDEIKSFIWSLVKKSNL